MQWILSRWFSVLEMRVTVLELELLWIDVTQPLTNGWFIRIYRTWNSVTSLSTWRALLRDHRDWWCGRRPEAVQFASFRVATRIRLVMMRRWKRRYQPKPCPRIHSKGCDANSFLPLQLFGRFANFKHIGRKSFCLTCWACRRSQMLRTWCQLVLKILICPLIPIFLHPET